MQADWLTATAKTPESLGEGEHLVLDDAELRYFPAFYAKLESAEILPRLLAETPWQQDYLRIAGKEIAVPRLQAWYGDAESHYGYSGIKLTPHTWTPLLQSIKAKVETHLHLRFNSVLLNWYRDGNDSVAWHADDEKALGLDPHIASLSFGTSRRFELRHKQRKDLQKLKLDLVDGSLLLMASGLQRHWQHQIPKQVGLTGTRLNLTFRFIHPMA